MHSLEAIEFYARYHPRWFESVQHYAPGREYSDVYSKVIPSCWELERNGLWYCANPPGAMLPEQGWKLHISVCTKDSVAALKKALPILLEEVASFKFLLDPSTTSLANGKLWPRSSSGKFVTIYPTSLEQFYRLGHRLSEELHSFVGPYILSDRRWPGSMSVYYRYGGISPRTVLQIDGSRRHVISSPDDEFVPDVRTPYWSPPAWVSDPFPADERYERTGLTLDGGRFLITSALSFSNRGGVYKGLDHQTGREVVLKEARPYVELGSHQLEAIAVLKKEYRLLKKLAGVGYFVQPVKFFRAWEHAYLVEEFVPGEHIGRFTIRNNPLYSGNVTAATIDAYFDQMRGLWLQLVRAIAAAHDRGIVLGDLSFTNILVSEGQIRICDLDAAAEEGVDAEVGLYTPGMSTSGISGQANDYYALGAIMFGSIMLAHGITGFYPPSRRRFLDDLTEDLALPPDLIRLIDDLMERSERCKTTPALTINSIEQLPFGTGAAPLRSPRLALPMTRRYSRHRREELRDRLRETVAAIIRYLSGTADTAREDRLFPADLSVFETNPLSVAYGATGVLYALHHLSGMAPEHLVDWVLRRPVSNDVYPPGLYLGQAGIAWVLGELGYLDPAVQIMRSARRHEMLWHSADVLHGAAGYGLACLQLWNKGAGDEFLDDAARVGDHLLASCVRDERGAYWPDLNGAVSLGYAYGGSGIALFLLYLSLATRDSAPLQLGRQALDFELAQGVWLDGKFTGFPGSLIDPSEPPTEPAVLSCYWDSGSAGVGTVLLRYLAVTSDAALRSWLDPLADDASRKYAAFPHLFRGLAGLGNFLLDVWYQTGDERHLLAAWHVAEGVLLFRIDCEEGVAFPGAQSRRESADFATGAAGIGLFLNRLLKAEEGTQHNFNFVIDELIPSRHLRT